MQQLIEINEGQRKLWNKNHTIGPLVMQRVSPVMSWRRASADSLSYSGKQ